MPFGAAVSEHPVPAVAVGEVLGELLEQVGPEPDLAALFATTPLTGAMEDIVNTVQTVLRPRSLIGSTAVSVLGRSQEIEQTTALTLWAGSVGSARPVRLTASRSTGGGAVGGLPDDAPPDSTLLLLADPFTFPADDFLTRVSSTRPDIAVIGGLASAARGPGGNRLVLDGSLHHDGGVGVLLDRGAVNTVVSQGCSPVGEPMIVTRSERNMLYELAGEPAMERLGHLMAKLTDDGRRVLAQGLQLGVVVDENRAEFGRGDFLLRGVLGADRENGAIAIGDEVAIGTTVQFHVRDATTADEDLRATLDEVGDAAAALVFTCTGRGTHLFGDPHHDAELVAAITGDRCAGMFCGGEIGPVGARSYLHGFTASIALFDER